MKEYVKILVDNYDFESLEDFREELRKNRGEVIEWLRWRAEGGKLGNEITTAGLSEACKELLKLI